VFVLRRKNLTGMDANELNALLEDVRDFMAMLKTGERAYVDTLTATAKENKFAAKAIGHIIEQQLLKVLYSCVLARPCSQLASCSRGNLAVCAG
jgi:hypothetical protein